MPYVNIKVTRDGLIAAEQKRQLIDGSTRLLQEVLNKDPATTCRIPQSLVVLRGVWGRAGRTPAIAWTRAMGLRLPTRPPSLNTESGATTARSSILGA